MIYVLLGQTCSGKTTLLKKLLDRGARQIVTYTTRERRENEVDGVDYHFISKHQYAKMNDFNMLACKFTAQNGWMYGININDIDEEKDYFVILEPNGYRDLVKKLGKENVTSIYLHVPMHERLSRGLERLDSPKEFLRRLSSDHKDFKDLALEVDYVLTHYIQEYWEERVMQIAGMSNE